jgi:hypothetical protein
VQGVINKSNHPIQIPSYKSPLHVIILKISDALEAHFPGAEWMAKSNDCSESIRGHTSQEKTR